MCETPKVFVMSTIKLRSAPRRAKVTETGKGQPIVATETKSKSASKAAKGKTAGSVTAVVFVPSGPVPRDSIFKTAITAVRDQIPVVYTLTPEISDVSDKKKVDGVEGREYTVAVHFDTDVEGAEPVNVDAEIERLTVPALNDFNVATQASEAPPAPDDPK